MKVKALLFAIVLGLIGVLLLGPMIALAFGKAALGGDWWRATHRPPPLPEIEASLRPDDKGVESLARQIKVSGRAYPLFDIAQMILQKPERHLVLFSVKKNAEGKPVQPLFVCALDETLWGGLSRYLLHGGFDPAEKRAVMSSSAAVLRSRR